MEDLQLTEKCQHYQYKTVKWAVTTLTTSSHYQVSFMFFKHLFAPLLLASIVSAAPANVENRESCSAVHHVHICGTGESGFGAVGTPLRQALESAIPGTTSYAIPYNTSPEYVTTVAEGARMTERYLATQSAHCPNQRFVLSGYSKGALVLHETNLSGDLGAKVSSVLVFGDPHRKFGRDNSWPINSPSVNSNPRDGNLRTQNVASFCNSGDEFCDPKGVELTPHLAYSYDGSIGVAANFAKERA